MDRRVAPPPCRRRSGAGPDVPADCPLQRAGAGNAMTASACRFCGAALRRSFVDLGRSPLSNAFLTADQLREMEPHYPLHAYVCETCLLVQLEALAAPATIFTEYPS